MSDGFVCLLVLPSQKWERRAIYKPLRHCVIREERDDREYNNSQQSEQQGASLSLWTFGQSSACFHLAIYRLRTEVTVLWSVFDHQILFFSTHCPTRSTIPLHPGPTFLSLFSSSRRSRTLKKILFLSTQVVELGYDAQHLNMRTQLCFQIYSLPHYPVIPPSRELNPK